MKKGTSRFLENERLRFYLLYTVIFCLFSILLYSPFLITEKSFIWQTDGLVQHFNSFVYLGTWGREILKNLFFQHQLIIPMWEFGIGYGADIFTTLQYYVLGDPLALFSVVTPSAYAEEMYCLLILFRLYLSGVAFCAFCRKMGCGRAASLCGAFAYAFCCFAIYAAVRHPYFASPMIYLPLILLGAEKILHKEPPTFYIIMIFIATMSNFYFFYMLAILTVIYVTFRFFSLYQEQIFRNVIRLLAKFVGYSLIGVLMACVLFFPVCMAFLSDTRAVNDYTFDFLYSRSYYESFLGSFVTDFSPGSWSIFGVAPVVFLGTLGLFMEKGKYRWIKNIFLLLTLFLLIPYVGYIFNGFGYVSNRWVFGYAFISCFMFTLALPGLLFLSKKKKAILGIISIVYCLLCLFLERSRQESTMAACMVLMVSLVILWSTDFFPTITWKRFRISSRRLAQSSVFIMVLLGIFVNGTYRYSIAEENYISQFRDRNTTIDLLQHQRANVTDLIDDTNFYRFDQTSTGVSAERNFLLSDRISSTTGYWSLQNALIPDYLGLNSAYPEQSYVFTGLLSRSLLEPFASASYFICDDYQESYVPYGYEYVGSKTTYDGNRVLLYHSDNALPLGYTCDSWLSRAEYNALSIPQRQQAMLYGAVIEEEGQAAVSHLANAQPEYRDVQLPYSIETDDNIEISGNTITVKNYSSKMTLNFDCPVATELYVQFTGLHFESHSKYDFLTEEEYAEMNGYDHKVMERSLRYWQEAESTALTAVCANVTAAARHYTDRSIYTDSRTDYLLNLNYSDKERTSLTLTFENPGIYTFDELSIISQPVDMLEECTDAMKEDVLEQVEISTNRITGSISLEKDKLLCLSIPYSKGWKLYVDGKETELLQTNVMYMSAPLTAGDHQIELRYTTPNLKLGLLLSGVGFAAFIVMLVVIAVRRKRTAHR